MSSQSRQFQRKILDAAQRDGYADLYWFAEGTLPPALRQSRFSDGHIPGCYPGKAVPVVAVAPDPEVSKAWAELLCALFQAFNPRIEFSPALTHLDSLIETGAQWYKWGELDVVCQWCGAVNVRYCCDEAMRAYDGDEAAGG